MGVGAALGTRVGIVDGKIELEGTSDGKSDGGDDGEVVGSGVFSGLSCLLLAANTGRARQRIDRSRKLFMLKGMVDEDVV